jgi:hypothetical protein
MTTPQLDLSLIDHMPVYATSSFLAAIPIGIPIECAIGLPVGAVIVLHDGERWGTAIVVGLFLIERQS